MKKLTLKDLYKNKKVRVLDKTRGRHDNVEGVIIITLYGGGGYLLKDIESFEPKQLELFDVK